MEVEDHFEHLTTVMILIFQTDSLGNSVDPHHQTVLRTSAIPLVLVNLRNLMYILQKYLLPLRKRSWILYPNHDQSQTTCTTFSKSSSKTVVLVADSVLLTLI